MERESGFRQIQTLAQETLALFAVAAPGLEEGVCAEVTRLGGTCLSLLPGGVAFQGDLELLMRVNLWSRLASRVLVRLAAFPAFHLAQLDKRSRRVEWRRFLPAEGTVGLHVTCRRSKIYHSDAARERVLVAILSSTGLAEASDPQEPSCGVWVHLERDLCEISLDSSGELLHRRGLKLESSAAPLRETLAAALLEFCGYDGSEPLLDPLCGSGTLVLEAALLARRRAPGLGRSFAFQRWPAFPERGWLALQEEAAACALPAPPAPIHASDQSGGSAGMTRRNLERAGLSEVIVERRPAEQVTAPAPKGLLVCNPPYGRRLGHGGEARRVYQILGDMMRGPFASWRLGMVTASDELAGACGLTFSRVSEPIAHGGLRVRFYRT